MSDTLSEIMEQCGPGFELIRCADWGKHHASSKPWVASKTYASRNKPKKWLRLEAQGVTAEEAVRDLLEKIKDFEASGS